MRYKLCEFGENRARDTRLQGVYIPHFGQIWVKISILGLLHPCRCTDGGEIWHGPPCQISSPSVQCVAPVWRKTSKSSRFALRAMLPVIIIIIIDNVYGAILMTMVTARVHPVHLMNTDWAPGGRQPSDQANRLGLWVCRSVAAAIHIHHRHLLLLLSPSKILLEQEMMGWQWHQLVHMQIICTSLQTDNHDSTSPLSFYRPYSLLATQPIVSKHWRSLFVIIFQLFITLLFSIDTVDYLGELWLFLPNANALVAVSKGLWAVKLL